MAALLPAAGAVPRPPAAAVTRLLKEIHSYFIACINFLPVLLTRRILGGHELCLRLLSCILGLFAEKLI